MNILFLVSACFWSYIVGRAIAFGPKCTVFTWIAEFPPDSWYCLTNIPLRMPPKLVRIMPILLLALSVPGLLINNTLTHSIVVLFMVNEQCYMPVFSTRVFDSVIYWPLLTAILNICFALTINNIVVIGTLAVKAFIFVWFSWIEFKCLRHLIREELPYEERQPRTV